MPPMSPGASSRAPPMLSATRSASLPWWPIPSPAKMDEGKMDVSEMHDVRRIFSWNSIERSEKHAEPSRCRAFFETEGCANLCRVRAKSLVVQDVLQAFDERVDGDRVELLREDKQAEAQDGYWNCPCVPMRERHECHCM